MTDFDFWLAVGLTILCGALLVWWMFPAKTPGRLYAEGYEYGYTAAAHPADANEADAAIYGLSNDDPFAKGVRAGMRDYNEKRKADYHAFYDANTTTCVACGFGLAPPGHSICGKCQG